MVSIGPASVTTNFMVSDQIEELLIGIDWLRDSGCALSFADLTLELQGHRFPLCTKTKNGPYTELRKISELHDEKQDSQIDRPFIVPVDGLTGCSEQVMFNSQKVTNASCFCYLVKSNMESEAGVLRPFVCRICARRFKRQFDLSRHERDKHSIEPVGEEKRPFPCAHCYESFTRQFDLDRHDLAKHLQIRVFCPVCGANLSSAGVLQRHMRTVHATASVPRGGSEKSGMSLAATVSVPDGEPGKEVKEQYSVLRVQDGVPEDGASALMEVEAR